MILKDKSLEKLRILINEETQYRSGPQLVSFFNELGFNENYGAGFPSRWIYTDSKLKEINGTPELDKCIKLALDPINFIDDIERLDSIICDFNKYLAFDKWQIFRKNEEISFRKKDKVEIIEKSSTELNENEFLEFEFEEIPVEKLGLDSSVSLVLAERLTEIRKCLSADAPLSMIFLCGSTLEGILLGIATNNPKQFNQSKCAPIDNNGKVRPFHEWSLNNLIDVSCDVGAIKEDVKKFSHSLRDFRNYIHPYQQVASRFSPNIQTAKISWQVLKAAIYQLTE